MTDVDLSWLPPSAAKRILTAWPGVVSEVTKRLAPLIGLLADDEAEDVAGSYAEWNAAPAPAPTAEAPAAGGFEDASGFVRHMATLEGQIRTAMIAAGCNCKMDVCGKVIQGSDTDCVLSVFSMHEPICSFAQKLRLQYPELEEQAEPGGTEPTTEPTDDGKGTPDAT